MPSAESRLHTGFKSNFLNCLVCSSPGPAFRVLVVGTTVPGQEPGVAPDGGMLFASLWARMQRCHISSLSLAHVVRTGSFQTSHPPREQFQQQMFL